jgi:hypothetical protein
MLLNKWVATSMTLSIFFISASWRRHNQRVTLRASSTTEPDARVFAGLWQLGILNSTREGTLNDVASRAVLTVPPAVDGVPLHIIASGTRPHVVPRAPAFRSLVRPTTLPPPPKGALHLDRPISGDSDEGSLSCLSTNEPVLSQRSFTRWREWTLEAVVLFLYNEHFAHQWQTIIGRNGV